MVSFRAPTDTQTDQERLQDPTHAQRQQVGGNAQAAQPRQAARQEVFKGVNTADEDTSSDVSMAPSPECISSRRCIICDTIDEPCGGMGNIEPRSLLNCEVVL